MFHVKLNYHSLIHKFCQSVSSPDLLPSRTELNIPDTVKQVKNSRMSSNSAMTSSTQDDVTVTSEAWPATATWLFDCLVWLLLLLLLLLRWRISDVASSLAVIGSRQASRDAWSDDFRLTATYSLKILTTRQHLIAKIPIHCRGQHGVI